MSQIELQCQENRLKFPDRLSACGRGGLGTRLGVIDLVVQLQTIRCLEYTPYSELWADQYRYWTGSTTSSARRIANCLASKVYTTIIIQYTQRAKSMCGGECVWRSRVPTADCACDRRAIRLAYGPSTGTVDLFGGDKEF